MLDIVISVLFLVMAYRVSVGVHRESAIFQEFRQSRALGLEALLFPVGPFVVLYFAARSPIVGLGLAVACYLPSLLLARTQKVAFERAGTDRVASAMSVVSEAFGTSLLGLAYVVLWFVYMVAVGSLRGITDA